MAPLPDAAASGPGDPLPWYKALLPSAPAVPASPAAYSAAKGEAKIGITFNAGPLSDRDTDFPVGTAQDCAFYEVPGKAPLLSIRFAKKELKRRRELRMQLETPLSDPGVAPVLGAFGVTAPKALLGKSAVRAKDSFVDVNNGPLKALDVEFEAAQLAAHCTLDTKFEGMPEKVTGKLACKDLKTSDGVDVDAFDVTFSCPVRRGQIAPWTPRGK